VTSFADIPIIVKSLKDAKGIADAIRQLDKEVAVNEKASELFNIIIDLQSHVSSLQSDLMLIQSQYQELLQVKDNLEKQLVQMGEWEITKSNYKFIAVGIGNFVYESTDTSAQTHWICPNCYEKQKKSILQVNKAFEGRKVHLDCPNCEINFPIFYDQLPSYIEDS